MEPFVIAGLLIAALVAFTVIRARRERESQPGGSVQNRETTPEDLRAYWDEQERLRAAAPPPEAD